MHAPFGCIVLFLHLCHVTETNLSLLCITQQPTGPISYVAALIPAD